jgi:iron complex outermembrane receptor protein
VGLDGEASDKVFLKSKWSDLVLTAVLSQRDKSIPTGAYDARFNSPNDWTDQTALLDLSFGRAVGTASEVSAHLGMGSYRFASREFTGPSDNLLRLTEKDRARWISGELRHDWTGWAGHRIMTGFEFQSNRRQSVRIATLTEPETVNEDLQLRSSRHAWFVNDEWALTRTVSLTTGLRLDRRLDHEWTTTPRLAAIWSPSPDWTFKWLQGRAFREPNAVERFFAQADADGNRQPLKVETIRSSELATLWRPAAQWSVSLSLFHFRVSDLVESSESAEEATTAYVNRGSVHVDGAELEGTWVGRSGLQLRVGGSAQWAEDGRTGQRLSDAPTRLGKLTLTMPGPFDGTRIGLNLSHVSERVTLDRGRAPGYTVLNTHFMLAPPGRPWWFALGAYNLTDRRYVDPASPEQRQDTIRQDGREIRLQLGRRL